MAIHLRSISEYDKLTSEDDVLNVIMNSTSAIAEVSYTNTSNSNLSTFQFDLKLLLTNIYGIITQLCTSLSAEISNLNKHTNEDVGLINRDIYALCSDICQLPILFVTTGANVDTEFPESFKTKYEAENVNQTIVANKNFNAQSDTAKKLNINFANSNIYIEDNSTMNIDGSFTAQTASLGETSIDGNLDMKRTNIYDVGKIDTDNLSCKNVAKLTAEKAQWA